MHCISLIFGKLDEKLGVTGMQYLRAYVNSGSGKQFNERIRDRIDTLTRELETIRFCGRIYGTYDSFLQRIWCRQAGAAQSFPNCA